MTIHPSFTNWVFRVWIAFFASVCILASVYADTVNLYYVDPYDDCNETFKTSGNDVGDVLNSGYSGNTLKITGSTTHSQKVTTSGLSIYGIDDIRQINVQSSDPNVPFYAFAKNQDRLNLTMKNIEYCGNADQNVRSVFFKDEYTGTSYNGMSANCFNVTISSFVDPDSDVCVFDVGNPSPGPNSSITLLSDPGYPNTFSNNKGCIRARALNFNPATTANGPTGEWHFNNNFANNGSAWYCYQLLLKDAGTYFFKENSATFNGGAIFNTADYDGAGTGTQEAMCHLNHSESILRFEGNTAGEKGGAIYGYESQIRIGGQQKTFINNRAGIGLDGKLLSDNIVSGKGGAIYCEIGSLNEGYVYIYRGENTFESNLAYGDGGAIYSERTVQIGSCTSVKFQKNVAGFTDESTGEYHQGNGGAIYSKKSTYIEDAPSEFSENSAYYGGAIYSEQRAYLYYSTMTFSNNTATQGGAIYSPYLELWGDTSSMTFTGNYGAFYGAVNDKVCGNDIYMPVNEVYAPVPRGGDECTNLAFVEAGAFSFDGGIYIERGVYDDNPNNTIIRGAQVTIAGRANDSTNYYQFRRTFISNGGKLTAKLNEIEGVNGIITMDNKTDKLELNVTGANTKKLTMSVNSEAPDDDLAVQGSGKIEKTGDGTLQILAEAEGLVRAESFVVSSGRLDYKGYYTGALEVGGSEAEAVFSPGNSVGDAYVEGNVKIRNNGAALFEFGKHPDGESPDDDFNHDVLYITNGNFSAGNQMISLYFEEADEADWSYEGCKYLLVSGAGLPEGKDYTRWLDGNFTGLFSLLSESNNLYLVYPLPEPIPEPSTWALLALGAAGLLYVRKRKN